MEETELPKQEKMDLHSYSALNKVQQDDLSLVAPVPLVTFLESPFLVTGVDIVAPCITGDSFLVER
jgi:hypothetical protein